MISPCTITAPRICPSRRNRQRTDRGAPNRTLRRRIKWVPQVHVPPSLIPDLFEDVIYPKGDPDAVSISKREIEVLQPDTFLNDTIINFHIKYLIKASDLRHPSLTKTIVMPLGKAQPLRHFQPHLASRKLEKSIHFLSSMQEKSLKNTSDVSSEMGYKKFLPQ